MIAKIDKSAAGLCFIVFFILLSVSPVSAEEWATDTLRLVEVNAYPGENFIIPVYIANSLVLGGYTIRFTYDTALVEPITIAPDNPAMAVVPLRGSFSIFNFELAEPGVIAGVAVIFSSGTGMEIGSGTAVELPFRAKSYALEGSVSPLTFIPHPDSPNSSNWFSDITGLIAYEPTRLGGSVWIGCICAEMGDADSDGGVNPVDVVLMTNYIYKGFLTTPIKQSSCPVNNGDFNCDGRLNPVDLVMYVNYVYRGDQTGPCDPCVE